MESKGLKASVGITWIVRRSDWPEGRRSVSQSRGTSPPLAYLADYTIGARHIISFFDLLPWKFPLTSMELSMEVGGSIFVAMGISMEVGGSRFTSMEVGGSFHVSAWKFPL